MSKFDYRSKVCLGQVVSLSDGMEPDHNEPFTKTLFMGSQKEIDDFIQQWDPDNCDFEAFPTITPCKTIPQLIHELYKGFKVDGRTEAFSAAAILKEYGNSSEALKKVTENLNIPQIYTDPSKFSFILARVPRELSGKPVTLSASAQLEGKKNYLKKFQDFKKNFDAQKDAFTNQQIGKTFKFLSTGAGSHFVHSVIIGDEAIQVFVYDSETYQHVCDTMDKNGWTGPDALQFQYFTSKRFCTYAAPVELLSRDPEFEQFRPLLKDKIYNLEESIFRFFSKEIRDKLCGLTKLTCVGTELRSVIQWSSGTQKAPDCAFAYRHPQEVTAEDFIYSIGVQGCISRFGTNAGPGICWESARFDYSKIYSAFSKTDMMAVLWSPYLSISQMYVRLDEFWNSPSLNKSDVKHFIVTADVIEIQGDIDFSRLESLTLVCRLLIAGNEGSVPKVKLAKESCKPLELYCDRMIGNCLFEEATDVHNNQLIFSSKAVSLDNRGNQVEAGDIFAGRFPTRVLCDDGSQDIVKKWRQTALLNSIETLLSSAYVAIYPQRKVPEALAAAAAEARNCVKWVDGNTGKAVQETTIRNKETLSRLYARTTMILNNCASPEEGAASLPSVPTLRYEAYKKPINALLNLAESYAKEIEKSKAKIEKINQELQNSYREAERDKNIKKIVQFMIEQNKAFAAREKDLQKSHNEIIFKKEEMIAALGQRRTQLQSMLTEYQSSLNETGKAINDALNRLHAEEASKAAFEFVVGVAGFVVDCCMGVCTGFSVSGATDKVEKMLKRIECVSKFVEMCGKIIEASESLADHLSNINDFKKISLDKMINQDSALDWEIIMNEMEAKVVPLEDYVKTEATEYLSVLRNLTSVAQSIYDLDQQQANLMCEIFEEGSRSKVAEEQEKRLKELNLNLENPNWKPDADYLADLGQFQAILQQKQNNVLITLVDLLRIQDDSMSFHYLSEPTAITEFDILSLKESISSQALAALKALERYPYKITDLKKPVEVRLKDVLTSDLQEGKSVVHYIDMTHDVFETLAHVRINSLDVRINGVSTDTGKCHVVVETLGNPMHDRGFDRHVLSYKMVSQEWHIVYDIENGETIIGTDPARDWGKYYTKPAPFQSYRISIPKTSENKGIRFEKGLTDITLSFMLEAAYSPVPAHLMGDTNSGIPDFITLLDTVSISDGWDAVSFFSIDAINALWEKRYQQEVEGFFSKEDRRFIQEINVSYQQPLSQKVTQEYVFSAKTSAPRVGFLKTGKNDATIEIPLLKTELNVKTYISGELDEETIEQLECEFHSADEKQYTIKIQTTKRQYENGKLVHEETDTKVKAADHPSRIKTKTSLEKLQGQVGGATVYIDPAFDFVEFEEIDFDEEVSIAICNEITKYLKSKKLQPWVLGQLKFDSAIDFLKVKRFDFQTHVPPASKEDLWPAMLGLYMLTATPEPPQHGIRQNWSYVPTWPISREMNGAVYFSADLLWEKEIKPALASSISPSVSIEKEKLDDAGIKFRLKACFNERRIIYSEEKTLEWFIRTPEYERYGTQDALAQVTLPFSNIHFDLNVDSCRLHTDCTWTEQFPYEAKSFGPGCASQKIAWADAGFSCSFSAAAGFKIDPKTCEITFDALGNLSPVVHANVDKHKFLWFDQTADSKKIADNAKNVIESSFKNLKVKFNNMPMFAITNILFPESKVLLPTGVYFPLDLVIVGVVSQDL